MNTYIELAGIKLYAFHGVSQQELQVGNDYEVYLKVGYPFEEAMQNDCLEETLNYAYLYEVIKTEMQTPSKLLEHVAGRIVHALQEKFPAIHSIELKVSKLRPPIAGEIARASVCVKL